MSLLANLRVWTWICALGAVVLYVFFVSLAAIPPQNVATVSIVVAILALLVVIHNLRVEHELADPGGDPRVRRALNRQRERRGF